MFGFGEGFRAGDFSRMARVVVLFEHFVGGDFDGFGEAGVCCWAMVAFVVSIHYFLVNTCFPTIASNHINRTYSGSSS